MTNSQPTVEGAFEEALRARNEVISHSTNLNARLNSLEMAIIEAAQSAGERRVKERLQQENEALRVLFLVPHTSLFDAFLPIYQRMVGDAFFEVEVLSFRRQDIETTETADETRSFYQALGIDAHVVGFDANGFLPDIDSDCYDLVFYTLGSSAYPEKYRIENTSKRLLTCYIAYGFLLANQIEYQFNQTFHHAAWRIFAATPREEALYRLYSPRAAANAVLTGYTKSDLYADHDPETKPAKPLVIWAPHWTIGLVYPELNLGTFDKICMDMMTVFDAFPDIEFLYKPHPNLPYALEKTGFMKSDNYRIYLDMLAARPNVKTWFQGNNISLFRASSGMITDSVSFLAEYVQSGQPLLFLDRADRMAFNEAGEEIVNLHYKGQDIADIKSFIANIVRDGNDSDKARRQEAFPALIGLQTEPASAQITDHLKEVFSTRTTQPAGRTIKQQIAMNAASSGSRNAALSEISNAYWLKQTNYNYAELFEVRHRAQIAFADRHFIPRLTPQSRVIDIGCADGWHSVRVAAHCRAFFGYDLNPQFIELARKNALAIGLANCQFEVANALTLSLPPAMAHAVMESGLTTCMTRDEDALRALEVAHGALAPKGVLLLKDTLHRGLGDRIHMTGGYAGCYRALSSYEKLVRDAGFEILAGEWIDVSGDNGSYMLLAEKR